MRRKTQIFLAYLALLLASHLVVDFGGRGKGETEDDAFEWDAEKLVLVFARAGNAQPEASALQAAFGTDTKVVVVKSGSDEQIELWRSRLAERPSVTLEVVGIGYGSVDAVVFSEAFGPSLERLTLVSPVISTRFELLGDDRLNTALKAFQLAWFWVLENGVPHFGLSDRLPYNYSSASRIFYADQDEASRLFSQQRIPTRILYHQGGGFSSSGALAAYGAVRPDIEKRGYADLDGLRALLVASTLGESGSQGLSNGGNRSFESFPGVQLAPLWAASLLALSTLASEDFACIGGGLLAASGSVGLLPAIIGCLLGIFFGDLAIYFIGRVFGATALELPILRHLVSAKSLNRSSQWFEKRGVALVVLTRFFPGSRVPTYFAAGVVKASWVKFSLALLLASAIWTPILVLSSYFLGEAFLEYFESLGVGGWLGILGFVVCFAIGVRLFAKLATWKGRRLLLGSWRRLTRWEFWPMWAVYAPVFIQILWLALRYRSVSLPFSVNPCMPASGLVYESKIQILDHLEKSGAPIARFEAIHLDLTLEEKLSRMAGFMERLGLGYPVVLKPDIGQRGQGVMIAKSESDARRFFEDQQEDTIVQEYVGGTEYGVFYHRFAGADQGEVSSVTDKRTTSVKGDGRSTLEELILRDERAVCMAPYFFNEYENQLEEVPASGEPFMLASIGTHSRGAVFLDGSDLMTEALEREIDRFSKGIEGFHFGRYDLRVPDEESFKRGEGIRVIELNGITSEPTNMYDPKHGPLFGWSSLMRQWRLIFALAKENRIAGHDPVSKREVLKLALGHFRGLASRDLS